MTQKFASLSAILSLCLCASLSQAEVLEHISDETETGLSAPEPPQNDDRRIIYRVICTPGGEALPDCERSFNDTETIAKPEAAENPEPGIDNTGLEEEATQASKPAKVASKKTKKTTPKSKKPGANKKPKKAAKTKKATSKK